jgi:hypothetical protein
MKIDVDIMYDIGTHSKLSNIDFIQFLNIIIYVWNEL